MPTRLKGSREVCVAADISQSVALGCIPAQQIEDSTTSGIEEAGLRQDMDHALQSGVKSGAACTEQAHRISQRWTPGRTRACAVVEAVLQGSLQYDSASCGCEGARPTDRPSAAVPTS